MQCTVYWMNSYSSSPECLEKADRTSSHLLVGHNEERPIIPQPRCVRCHRAGTGQTTLEVIGSKRSYALNWCKLNSDDCINLFYLLAFLRSKSITPVSP